MKNVFMRGTESHSKFSWDKLGDIKEGRQELGEDMPVLVYRILQYSLNDVLTSTYGADASNDVFRKAGHLAGMEFAKNVLPLDEDLNTFMAALQQALRELKIGILRVEEVDMEAGKLIMTVGEDLDCSGLPPTDEVVCYYDEGFISGILEAYTKTPFDVREIDCWANGDRVCRFQGTRRDG